jgi:hypothetical protein
MASVTILNSAKNRQEESATGRNSAQAQLQIGPYAFRALVLVSAAGWAHYKGVAASAGMILTIKVGPNTVAQDDSFEGESKNITFMASASHNFLLPKGESIIVEARVDPRGGGGERNTDTKVNLSCYALQT